ICLHGYQDHAFSLLRRLGWWEAELPFTVLALNGPFPIPIWDENGFIEAFSWYFRNSARGVSYVAPETTAVNLARVIEETGFKAARKVLLGYSQGGYQAAYLAPLLTN